MVVDVEGEGAFRRRLLDMGFIRGSLVRVIKHAPLNDPVEYCIGGTHVTRPLQDPRPILVAPGTPPPFCRTADGSGRGRRPGRGLGRGGAWRRRNR